MPNLPMSTLKLVVLCWPRGTIGALVGSYFSNYIPDRYYNMLIGVIILLLTILMLIKKVKPTTEENTLTINKKKRFLQTGFFGS
jgi:uncharacterized membrane protein YfcA